jgi:ubiquinone/menaquinone biosynthesis C-methylase UbiE
VTKTQDVEKEIEHFETTDWYRSNEADEIGQHNLNRYVDDLISRLKIGEKTKVLEIACGAGELGQLLVEKTNCDYVGLDLIPTLVAKARERFKDAGLVAKFFQGDAQKLPFESNYFDVVLVSYSLHHFPKDSLDQVTKEVYRVLKKSGTYYALEPNGLNPLVFKWWLFNSPERILPLGKKWRENRYLSVNESIIYPWQATRSLKGTFQKVHLYSLGFFPMDSGIFKRNQSFFDRVTSIIVRIPLINKIGASFIVISKK